MRPYYNLKIMLFAGAAWAFGASVAAADGGEHWRIFVGDHAEPVVRAIELDDGEAAGRFELDSYASIYRSVSGRTVFAVQGEVGKVAIVKTGIAFEDHGDHVDLDVDEAALLDITLEGAKPAHFFENDGRIAMFFDGEGRADIFTERQVLDGEIDPLVIDAGEPHHGLASPMGRFVIHSVPNPEDPSKRVGLRVVGSDGTRVGADVPCPGVHGQAVSGRVAAFGCHDGIVLAMPGGIDGPELRHVSTLHLGEGNVSTLKGGTALQFFLASYGQGAVVLIEPGAAPSFRKIDLPTRRVDFAVDPERSRNAYVFTEDGQLHLLDVIAGTIVRSVRLTDPYSMDGHWRDPRPRLAVAGDHIVVTDPLAGVVRLVGIASFEEERTIAVEGMPYTVVAVGGSGVEHD